MFIRSIGLMVVTLVAASGVTQAQAPVPDPPASETTRTTETRRTTGNADRDDLLQHIGWELAEGDDGVRVERITTDSPVAKARLQENDIVKSVGGVNVRTPDRIREVLSDAAGTEETEIEIVVLRDGQELSYLLPLESMKSTRTSSNTQTTTARGGGADADLVQMIQQLQAESRQQQALLQTLLTEVQTLRTQLGVTPDTQINNTTAVPPPSRQSTGNVAPRGVAPAPNAAGRRPQ